MSILSSFRRRLEPLTAPQLGPAFSSVDIDAGILYGTYPAPTTPMVARVNRKEAMSVPAVKRARDLIAGSLGSLPLTLLNPDGVPYEWNLFKQPEADVPRSVTLTNTFEDMLFESVGWWRITQRGWHGRPIEVCRLDPRTVTVQQDQRVYETVRGAQGSVLRWIPDDQLIRFDGPNDPLLVAGARAIRSAIQLDAAALRHAEGSPPLDFFTPADGASDPDDDDAIIEVLDNWKTARATRSTGYVPAALKYNISGYNPEQLQLQAAREHAVTEIARLAGLATEYLGVSTTSRTYQNSQDERRFLMDFTLRGFLTAFQDRLSMDDVTPRGFTAQLSITDFIASDDESRMNIAVAGKNAGILTVDQALRFFDPNLPNDVGDTANTPAAPAAETAPVVKDPSNA